jgi:hypothetical protein
MLLKGGRTTFFSYGMCIMSVMLQVHTAEPLEPGPSRLQVEIAIAKLKKYKSPVSDEIPAELIEAGGEISLSAIHKLINSVWNKKWKESIIVPVHKKGGKTDYIVGYHCYHLHTTFYGTSSSQG